MCVRVVVGVIVVVVMTFVVSVVRQLRLSTRAHAGKNT